MLTGVGLERQVRKEKILDLSPWQKDGYNFIQIGKNADEDAFSYACAIYLCRVAKPVELIDGILQKE